MVRKIKLILVCILFMITLCGCWGNDCDNVPSDLTARAGVNQDVVDSLVAADLLDKSTGETIKESITQVIKANDNIPKQAITWYMCSNNGHDFACYSTKPTIHNYATGDFPYRNASFGSKYGYGNQTNGEIQPIPVVGVNQVEILKKELAYTVCVLKLPDEGSEDKYKSLDELASLVELVKKSKSTKTRTEYFNKIDDYFYDTEEPLLDPVKEPIIKETKMPSLRNYHICVCDDEECTGADISAPQIRNGELGYDLAITHIGIPVAMVRIMEFNKPVVQKILGTNCKDTDKYLVDPVGKRAFLLEYPVNYIEKVEIDADNKYKSTIKEAEMTVNIYTGKLMNKNGVVMEQKKNKLIHIGGTGGENEIGTSSFVMYGKGKVKNIGYANKDTDSGAVVLRDYLELMYLPNVVEGESVIAPGRRLRILNFCGDASKQAAAFVDMNGNIIEKIESDKEEDGEGETSNPSDNDNPAHEIYVTDLVDLPTVGEGQSKNKLKLSGVENVEKSVEEAEEDKDVKTGGVEEAEEADVDTEGETGYVTEDNSGNDLLKVNYVSSISPTCEFPSDKVASGDGADLKIGQMIFYGILIDKNPFETALYSGWINKDDEEKGCLSWWNDWLNQNQFNYKLDVNDIENAFIGNFEFDMDKEGFIVLNLDTISKIQRDMDESKRAKEVGGIRTIFVVLGFILMAYSMLLLAAWAFDCVIMTGFNLLGVLTLGRWVAVRSTADMPNIDTDGKYYIDFRKALISCMVIMGVGVLLTLIDVVEIIITIIKSFDGIANVIDKVILKN